MSETGDVHSVMQMVFESFNNHDLNRFKSLLSDDAVLVPGGKQISISGPDAIADAIKPTLDAIPDLKVTIANIFASANQGVAEVVRSGTHTGVARLPNGQVVNPTGAKVALPECIVFDVQNGKVKKMVTYVDMLDTLQQLGIIPAATDHKK